MSFLNVTTLNLTFWRRVLKFILKNRGRMFFTTEITTVPINVLLVDWENSYAKTLFY